MPKGVDRLDANRLEFGNSDEIDGKKKKQNKGQIYLPGKRKEKTLEKKDVRGIYMYARRTRV